MFQVQVKGPGIIPSSDFMPRNTEIHVISDTANCYREADGDLVVKLDARPAASAALKHRRARGRTTVVYPAGAWTSVSVERMPEGVTEGRSGRQP